MKNNKETQFENSMQLLQLMNETNSFQDPFCKSMWQMGLSPLAKGAYAAKAQGILMSHLSRKSILAQIQHKHVDVRNISPENVLVIGADLATDKPCIIDYKALIRHILILGPTGSGKTYFCTWLISQIRKRQIPVYMTDHKDDGSKYLNLCPDDLAIFGLTDLKENLLQPIGDSQTYYSMFLNEFSRAFNLRHETEIKVTPILLRIEAGLTSNQPYPSLEDLERILLISAEKESQPTLRTAAMAMGSLNNILGPTARIRKGPGVRGHKLISVLQCLAAPPYLVRFLSAVSLYRYQLNAAKHGHTTDLTEVYYSDEATHEFGRELSSSTGSGYIPPQKRRVTQVRSSGQGIIANVQSLADTDKTLVDNAGTFVCLGCSSSREAREAAQLLRMPAADSGKLTTLTPGLGWIWSDGFSAPIQFKFPYIDMGRHQSEAEVNAHMKPLLAKLDAQLITSPIHNTASKPIFYSEVLGEDTPKAKPKMDSCEEKEPPLEMFDEHRQFITEILENSDLSTVKHYKNLSWSAGRGNRIKNELIDLGLVRVELRKSGAGRPSQILVVSDKAKELIHETS